MKFSHYAPHTALLAAATVLLSPSIAPAVTIDSGSTVNTTTGVRFVSETIISNTGATSTLGSDGHMGHGFTMPDNGPYNRIHWSWLKVDQTTRIAAGNLFLLTEEYLGNPANLSPLTPGYIAESIGISNNAYVFDASVILQPLTQYWVYMGNDAELAGGSYSFGNPYPGGKAYETFSRNEFWNNGDGLDFNFILSGTSIPEPASLLLISLGMSACVSRTTRTRRHRHAS